MVELADMQLFVQAERAGSLSAAGRVLGLTPAVCSKRLTRLESHLGVRLMHRTSRQLVLTEEGRRYLAHCRQILADIADAETALGRGQEQAHGRLRITAPVALGRKYIGPVVAALVRTHPEVDIDLSLTDRRVDLLEEGFDCAIRIGHIDDSRLVARPLAGNGRILCASPAYLAEHGMPSVPADLARHDCIVLAGDRTWDMLQAETHLAARITPRARLITDNGEQAGDWARNGLGIMRRSYWDVADALADGSLSRVLPGWESPTAPLHLIYPSRRLMPARVRIFIESVLASFGDAQTKAPGMTGGFG